MGQTSLSLSREENIEYLSGYLFIPLCGMIIVCLFTLFSLHLPPHLWAWWKRGWTLQVVGGCVCVYVCELCCFLLVISILPNHSTAYSTWLVLNSKAMDARLSEWCMNIFAQDEEASKQPKINTTWVCRLEVQSPLRYPMLYFQMTIFHGITDFQRREGPWRPS